MPNYSILVERTTPTIEVNRLPAGPLTVDRGPTIAVTITGRMGPRGLPGELGAAAADVTFAPTDDIAATDVQAAIVEVEENVDTVEAGLAAHLADSSAAHAGTAVSFAPTGDLSSTDVESAINELEGMLDTDEAALAAHIADVTAAHAASSIGFTPTDDIAATDVQGAILEVEGDVDLVETAISDHLADPTDAHDATAISFAPTGGISATEVQAALVELDTEKATVIALAAVQTELDADEADLAAHLADGGDAHDASAISSVPAGNLASTDVQAALNELDSEKVAASTLTETVQDIVGAEITAGTNVSVAYDDALGTVTITVTTETVQDIVGALVGVSGLLTVNYDDPGNTLTIGLTTEAVQDVVGALIGVTGGLLTYNYDDAGNAIAIGLTTEAIQDVIGALISGSGIATAVYDDTANTFTVGVSVEAVQDTVGAFLVGSGLLTATYDDAGNVETLAVTAEAIEDALNGVLVGTATRLSVTYDDAANTFTFDVGTEGIQDIVGAFLTATGLTTAIYDDAGNLETIGVTAEAIEDALNGVLVGGSHISVTYDDAANTFTFAVTGLTAANVTFTPAGNIASATVQAALEEVDAEKVAGPGSATDTALALFDGTGGKLLKDSGVTISTDNTLGGGSPVDTKTPTQKAIVDYFNAGGISLLTTLAGLYEPINQRQLNAKTADYTFVAGDQLKTTTFTAAVPVTATIPAAATVLWTIRQKIKAQNLGTSTLTIAGAPGVTIIGDPLVAPNVEVELEYVSLNVWFVHRQGINRALFTAGGSLLYSTAAFTAAELLKGTALRYLRMNAAATAPEWALPPLPQTFGRMKTTGATITHTVPGVQFSNVSTVSYTNGIRRFSTFAVVGSPVAIDLWSMEVTTFQAASQTGFAIYAADEDHQPTGSSLFDSGNVATTSNGVKTGAMALTLPVGLYVIISEANVTGVVFRSVRGHLLGSGVFNPNWTANVVNGSGLLTTAYSNPIGATGYTSINNSSVFADYHVTFRITDPTA